MEKKKIIKGDVFIIPNNARELEDFFEPDWLKERLSRLAGIDVKTSERMVQVWTISKSCENWQDHRDSFLETLGICEEDFRNNYSSRERRLLGHFPGYFPSRIFEGAKEGDTLRFECPEFGIVIELTCKQLDYRYKSFGRFEEVFQLVQKG